MLKNTTLFIFLAIMTLFNGNSAISSEDELKITVNQEGTGERAEIGMSVSVHYTGKLEDGTVFDSSIPRGQPFTFTLGAGQVIKGWDLGVEGMTVGEKRNLVIPPHLGYGMRGAGASIPPNATLIFDVELLEVALPITLSELSPQEFIEAQEKGGIVIDIRREEEWRETGILKGKQNDHCFYQRWKNSSRFSKKVF